MYDALRSLGVKVFKSDANFLLFIPPYNIYEELRAKGINVRYVGDVASYRACLRVSINTHEVNNMFIDAVKDIINANQA